MQLCALYWKTDVIYVSGSSHKCRELGLGTLGLGFDLWSACALVLKSRDAIIALIRVIEGPLLFRFGFFLTDKMKMKLLSNSFLKYLNDKWHLIKHTLTPKCCVLVSEQKQWYPKTQICTLFAFANFLYLKQTKCFFLVSLQNQRRRQAQPHNTIEGGEFQFLNK